jgi:hypothetical protein
MQYFFGRINIFESPLGVMFSTQKLSALSFDRKGSAAGAVVAVVVVLIVVVAGFFLVANGNHATLKINVYSTHILADTEITVYVDGENIGTYATDNLTGWTITYDYSFSIFDDSKSIMVRAVSTGGYLGSQSDQEAVIVQDGGVYTISLYV